MSSPVLNIIVKLSGLGASSSFILYSNGSNNGLAFEVNTEVYSTLHLRSVMLRSADNGTPFPLFKFVRSFSLPFVINSLKSFF
jgi:hypothetical protein